MLSYYKNFFIKRIKQFKQLKSYVILTDVNYKLYIYFFFEELSYVYSDFIFFKNLLVFNKLNFIKVDRRSFLVKKFNSYLLFKYHVFFCIFFLVNDLVFYLNNNLFSSFIINNDKLNYVNIINKKFSFKELLSILRLKFLFCGINYYLYSNLYIMNFFKFFNNYSLDLLKLLVRLLYSLIFFFFKSMEKFFFIKIEVKNINNK
jgi:hypothetical protein